MRIVVQIGSGSQRGRKLAIRPGQVVTFGRTEWADVAVTDDQIMSDVHFSLEHTNGKGLLHDLDSTNGTKLNGVFVKEAVVRDGAVLVAGATQFVIRVEGNDSTDDAGPAADATAVRDRSRITLDASLPRPSYRVERCESELTRAVAATISDPATVAAVMRPLCERFSTYLIVDFKKSKLQPTPPPDLLIPLFDWLPHEVAMANSPLIIPPTVPLDRRELLSAAWDRDAVVVLFSEQGARVVTDHLQAATRLNLDGSMPPEGQANGMLGYCWPSVLAPLLAFRPPAFVDKLLTGIDAALIEVPDLPGSWQIYSHEAFPAILSEMGFREMKDEEFTKAAPDPAPD